MSGQYGHGGIAIGSQGAAAVKAEPAHPQHTGAGNGHGHIVGHHGRAGKTLAGAKHHGCHQRRYTGGNMYHYAAGKIIYAHFTQPAAAPYPVGDRYIHQHQPDATKQQHGREFHTLGKAADDQRRGNNGKGHLEHHKQGLGNAAGKRIPTHTGQHGFTHIPNPGIAFPEGQAITGHKP